MGLCKNCADHGFDRTVHPSKHKADLNRSTAIEWPRQPPAGAAWWDLTDKSAECNEIDALCPPMRPH